MVGRKKELFFKPIDIANNIPFTFSITEAEKDKSQANIVGKEGVDGSSVYQTPTLLEISYF